MFKVITDTATNLSNSVLDELDIEAIPFPYFVNGEEKVCIDIDNFNADEYYKKISTREIDVSTSQIPPQRYIDNIEPYLKAGKDVMIVCISSGISGSYNSAFMAAEQLIDDYPERTISVIDSKGASFGCGMVAVRAAKLSQSGMDIKEAKEAVEEYRDSIYQVFTVDSLAHLRRSGRISHIAAVVGTVMHIKPILKGNEEGKIVPYSKVKGRKKSIETLAEKYDELVSHSSSQTVYIAHSACKAEAEMLGELLKVNNPPKEIVIKAYEPMTGSHVGPGAIALFFAGENGVRLK